MRARFESEADRILRIVASMFDVPMHGEYRAGGVVSIPPRAGRPMIDYEAARNTLRIGFLRAEEYPAWDEEILEFYRKLGEEIRSPSDISITPALVGVPW